MMEEEQREDMSTEDQTPPTETNGNGDCNHDDSSVQSPCPAESSPDVTMDTEQSEDLPVTPQKSGSEPVVVHGNNNNPASEKLQRVRKWSINTYKVTKQSLCERLGRGSRTVDLDLERRLELLRDDRQRYDNVSQLAQTLANQIAAFTVTQKTLGDAFADLGLKTQHLHTEFGVNAADQRFVSKSGETLAAAVSCFSSDMKTLVSKTMEDTLLTARKYEAVRIEYDAYRVDLEELNLGPRDEVTVPKLENAQREFSLQKERFHHVRQDLTEKVQLLQENRVKVLHQQLWRLHSAVAAHSSTCHHFLETNWHDDHRLDNPAVDTVSFLEKDSGS